MDTEQQLLGFRVGAFEAFVDECGLRRDFVGKQVQERVRHLTSSSSLSLCAQIAAERTQWAPHVGRATMFLSHAWKFKVQDVVDSLSQCSPDEFVWYDLFSASQHHIPDQIQDFSWWSETFFSIIRSIGSLKMIMKPVVKPLTLSRAWCVFELYAAIVTGCTFEVLMPNAVEAEFLASLGQNVHSMGTVWEGLSHVRLSECEAGDPLDKQCITQVVEARGGFAQFERVVVERLKQWKYPFLESQIERQPEGSAKCVWQATLGHSLILDGKWNQAEHWLQLGLKGSERVHGARHADTLIVRASYWGCVGHQREPERAAAELKQCVEDAVEVCGGESAATSHALAEEGWLWMESLGGRAEARELLRKAWAAGEAAGGASSWLALNPLGNLAKLEVLEENWAAARPLYEDCYRRRRQEVGPAHVTTLTAGHYLGLIYMRQGRLAEAEEALAECVARRQVLYGEGHPYLLESAVLLQAVRDQAAGTATDGTALNRHLE